MNRKFEDKLAELAFGDLSPEETARLERSAEGNPEAQRTLSMYRDMRAGLKGLADIPEDQFSKERLRDAILTQGLKPVAPRPTSNRAWLWMPCAALLIGFGYTVVRQNVLKSGAPAEIVMGKADLKGTPLTVSPETIKVAENTTPNPLAALNASRGTQTDRHGGRNRNQDVIPDNVIVSNLGGENSEDPGYFYDGSSDDASTPASDAAPPTTPSRLDRGGTTVAMKTPPAKTSAANSGPIVLIDQSKDSETGAEDATEVSSASNVLVGG